METHIGMPKKDYLLEEEVISDELGLGVLVHALEGIEGSLKVLILEGLEGLNDLVHDIESLLLGKSGAEGELSEVSANSDTGGDDHSSIFGGEGRALELGGLHVGDVLGIFAVLVVVLNDLVEEGSEGLVAVVGASVATNAGVGVLATGENSLTEGEAKLVLLVLKLVPDLLGKVLGEEGLGACGELGEALNVFSLNEVCANGSGLAVINLVCLLTVFGTFATHCFICL